jgi:hypothetical protein
MVYNTHNYLSAMRLATHREDPDDVTDSSWVSTRFKSLVVRFYSSDGARGWHNMVSQILRLILCIGLRGLGLLTRFVD